MSGKMRWKKLGNLFQPTAGQGWQVSHAANPVALPIDDETVRVYYNSRDIQKRSSVSWIEFAPSDPGRILAHAELPSLTPGEVGCFDDSGCSIGCAIPRDGRVWLYYMGWNLSVTVPWRNAIGLAFSEDGYEFKRYSRAPIMDRSEIDPFTISYPWVLQDGNIWRMWYGSNQSWGSNQSDMNHVIKSARSTDGVRWIPDGRICVPPCGADEYAFARPCVVRDPDKYRMWFAFRGDAYRIGYAESADGETWLRRPSGIDPGPSDWDNESIEYPCVFDHGGRRYMLYCGNKYGLTGFGLAVLEG